MRVGNNLIENAKRVHLQKYLLTNFPGLIYKDVSKDRFYCPQNKDICILDRGYISFSTGQRGDQIQFLMTFLGKDFQAAVAMLSSYAGKLGAVLIAPEERQKNSTPDAFVPPKPSASRYKCVWAYLVLKKKIPADIVESLFEEKLLYQAEYCNNCVFISKDLPYAELCGTSDIDFHGIVRNSSRDGYWQMGDSDFDVLYLCLSPTDAISVYLLHKQIYKDKKVATISIGGYKSDTISRVLNDKKDDKGKILLAIDTTPAGIALGDKFPSIPKIRPKDVIMQSNVVTCWNDVLCEAPLDTEIIDMFDDVYHDSNIPF